MLVFCFSRYRAFQPQTLPALHDQSSLRPRKPDGRLHCSVSDADPVSMRNRLVIDSARKQIKISERIGGEGGI